MALAARTTNADPPPSRRELARQAILDKTVELVALRGPLQTTVRDIAELCGVNVAAVNYYFQSKDELLKQAMAEIFDPVNAERRRLLAEARARGLPVPAREILVALVQPIVDGRRAADGGSLYLRGVQQIRVHPGDPFSLYIYGTGDETAQAFIDAMAETFPQLDRRQLVWRYEFARGAAVHLLSNLDPLSRKFDKLMQVSDLDDPTPRPERMTPEAVGEILDLISTGFCG